MWTSVAVIQTVYSYFWEIEMVLALWVLIGVLGIGLFLLFMVLDRMYEEVSGVHFRLQSIVQLLSESQKK